MLDLISRNDTNGLTKYKNRAFTFLIFSFFFQNNRPYLFDPTTYFENFNNTSMASYAFRNDNRSWLRETYASRRACHHVSYRSHRIGGAGI